MTRSPPVGVLITKTEIDNWGGGGGVYKNMRTYYVGK
jgi:hypothetical protein